MDMGGERVRVRHTSDRELKGNLHGGEPPSAEECMSRARPAPAATDGAPHARGRTRSPLVEVLDFGISKASDDAASMQKFANRGSAPAWTRTHLEHVRHRIRMSAYGAPELREPVVDGRGAALGRHHEEAEALGPAVTATSVRSSNRGRAPPTSTRSIRSLDNTS
jgi:hypothetical protein